MNRLEKYEKQYLEDSGFDKAELYQELLAIAISQEQIRECEDLLKNLMGLDEFNKLSKGNFDMIVVAMHQYAENRVNE